MGSPAASSASDDQLIGWWIHVVGSALAVILLDEGYTATTVPGEPVELTKDDHKVVPFLEVRNVLRNETSAEDWTARLAELGLSDRHLV